MIIAGDGSRWLIYKSPTVGEWCILPPDSLSDPLACWFPTFEQARAAFAAGRT